MKSPAFQFYFSDFHASTSTWPPEYVGAYVRLLGYQWCNGSIPKDEKELSLLIGMPVGYKQAAYKVLISTVLKKFKLGRDGLCKNRRLEEERRKQKRAKHLQSLGGKRGMAIRYGSQVPYNSPTPTPVGGKIGKVVHIDKMLEPGVRKQQ